MDNKTAIAKGTEKFKAATKVVSPKETTTDEEETSSNINVKQLALTVGKVALGVGAVIVAYKIGAKMATPDEDQQDETA